MIITGFLEEETVTSLLFCCYCAAAAAITTTADAVMACSAATIAACLSLSYCAAVVASKRSKLYSQIKRPGMNSPAFSNSFYCFFCFFCILNWRSSVFAADLYRFPLCVFY